MIESRFRLKVLSLFGMVLGLIAFTAGTAQAEVGANWMVNGTNVNATLEPQLALAIENSDAILLTKILGILTHILCTAGELKNVKLLQQGKLSNGKVKFTGCDTLLEGKATPSAPCLPKTAGTNDIIETNEGTGLLKLHLIVSGGAVEALTYIKSVSGPLAVVESSEECAVGQKIKIEGELVLRDLTAAEGGGPGGVQQEAVTHLIEESSLSTLTAAGQKATIDGTANVKLTGMLHEGLKWCGLPSGTKP